MNPITPNSVSLSKFTAARAKEIQLLRKCLDTPSGTKMAFQKLPKHMRRRAMSHNVKRLPRSLREIHKSQVEKSGKPPKQKRPSRRYRRRPYNLLQDYTRRQQGGPRWLQTHIWHAKRFHMVEKWGYKLAHRPCDRGFRACYRATSKHCLLQDVSYINCVEITGEATEIIEKFAGITDGTTGLSIGAKAYIRGNREGEITLFQSVGKPIGLVYFQWGPEGATRKLWLWIHAGFYKETLDKLVECLQLKPDEEVHRGESGIELRELRDELCRFRLTGPLSQAILQNCLKPCSPLKNTPKFWEFHNNPLVESREIAWKALKEVSYAHTLSPRIILGLSVEDPRGNFPKIRTKSLPISHEGFQWNPTVQIWESPLWNPDIRFEVNNNKIPNSKLAELRSNLLVPGTDLQEVAAVPIMLIQRPGNQSSGFIGYGSGWDLVLPSAWAQSMWVALNLWGGRAGGLRETSTIAFESGQSDNLLPDTKAGQEEQTRLCREFQQEFFRKPPNKRVNFNKYKIASPFECNWRLLLEEWTGKLEEFVVIRDRNHLNQLDLSLKGSKSPIGDLNDHSLVPVRLALKTKGVCRQFSLICLPDPSDFQTPPCESTTTDPNAIKRKAIRLQHKDLLKKLRQRRKRARKNCKDPVAIDKEMLMSYQRKMRELWLPPAETIRKSCMREVIGFVTYGDFSFVRGQSCGVGYVVLGALKVLLDFKEHRNEVLVRNTDSKHYRLAKLEVICK